MHKPVKEVISSIPRTCSDSWHKDIASTGNVFSHSKPFYKLSVSEKSSLSSQSSKVVKLTPRVWYWWIDAFREEIEFASLQICSNTSNDLVVLPGLFW